MDTVVTKDILDLSVRDFFFKWREENVVLFKELFIRKKFNLFKTQERILFLGIDLLLMSLFIIILYL